nr:hypothetical protein [Tanacetum cinerariifolium]
MAYKIRQELKRQQKDDMIRSMEMRVLANSDLLKDQLLVYFDLKTQREVQLTTQINNLTRQLFDIIDERRLFIGELEQRLPANVMAYKTRQELKRQQKDDMIRSMEMSSLAHLDSMPDDSDIRLTSIVRPTNNPQIVHEITTTTQTLFSSQNNKVDNYVVKLIRIIPGPVDIVQTAKLRKLAYTREGREETVMSTQEYIRKVIEDVGEDADFTRTSWLSVLEYVNVDGGIVTGCFGDVKKFLKNRILEKVVAVIKSCTPNALGDLTITLKDLSGIISGTIHYKVLTEERFTKAITVEAALILHNVSVFSPKQSTHHYLNITKKNMVKVFHKDDWSA